MNILDIIAKKRDGKRLEKEEIEYFIQGYTSEEITDYQAAALVMAIYINGMDYEEIKDLTLAMAHSGEMLDLSDISDNIIDKHYKDNKNEDKNVNEGREDENKDNNEIENEDENQNINIMKELYNEEINNDREDVNENIINKNEENNIKENEIKENETNENTKID